MYSLQNKNQGKLEQNGQLLLPCVNNVSATLCFATRDMTKVIQNMLLSISFWGI